jgi:hypothetical protein
MPHSPFQVPNASYSFIFFTAVGAASVSYIRYRHRLARLGIEAIARPWHLRPDARFVLYVYSALQIAVLPVALYQTMHRTSGDFEFPIGDSFAALVGSAIVFYDQWRAARAREKHKQSENLCVAWATTSAALPPDVRNVGPCQRRRSDAPSS